MCNCCGSFPADADHFVKYYLALGIPEYACLGPHRCSRVLRLAISYARRSAIVADPHISSTYLAGIGSSELFSETSALLVAWAEG